MKKLAFLLTTFVLFSGFFAIFSEQKVFAQGCPNWQDTPNQEICYWSDSYPTCRSGGGFCGAAQGYPNLTVCEETFKDRHYKIVQQNLCDPSQFRYRPGTEDCHLFVQEHAGWIAEPQCSAGTCGNGVRESYEVCDPSAPATGGNDPANCDGTCHYTGSTASCGDGICSANENSAICPDDCTGPPPGSCTNPIDVSTIGSQNITVTQGNSAGFPYTVNSQSDQGVAVSFSGVTGATYSGQQGNFHVDPGNNYWSGVVNTAGVTPGTYALRVSVNSTETAGCSDFYDFNVTVQPNTPPVQPDDAQCAGWSVPSSVNTGQSFSASITMRNTGSNTWAAANYADTYPEGATYSSGPFTFGAQQQRPLSSASIPNNALSSFTYSFIAPATAATYTIKNQMLHHGVAWFGPVCTQNIAVTAPTVQYILTTSKNGTGSGTITSAPAGISCGSDCTESYANNTSVSLSATPASGSIFASWGGACSGSGACNVSMTQARNVTATFNTATTCDAFMNPASNAVVSNLTSTSYSISWTPQSGSYDNNTRIRVASNLNQTGGTQVGTYLGTGTYNSCPNPPLTGASQCIVNNITPGNISTYNITGAQPNTVYYNRLPTLCPSSSVYEDYVFTVTTPPAAGGTCDTTPGNNFMKGCLYDGINFSSLSATSIIESALSSPAPTNANPIPYKNWGTSGPNTSNVDTFSIRWKGTYNFAAGDYVFTIGGDDGVRAYFDDNNDGIPNGGNGVYIVNDWSNHGYRTTASPSTAVTAGPHTLVLEYYDDGVDAKYSLSWTSTPSAASCDPNTIGTNKLVGCTYNGLNFNTLSGFAPDGNTAGANTDNFTPLNNTSWGNGAPNASTNADNFTVRWKGNFNFSGGTYDFSVTNLDDGARVYLDGVLIRNLWSGFCCTTHNFSQVISAGQHRIDLEFQEIGGGANVGLSWAKQAVAPPPATANISANPTTVPYNTASTLSWSYSNATSCTLTPPGSLGGYPSASGSFSTGNLTAPRTYTLSCDPGSVSPFVTVNVQAQSTFNLTVVRSGQGTVTSNPVGISCGATCGYTYPADTSVSLTATPASGRIFVGWGGACSGRGACSVLLNSSKIVFANFAVDPGFKEF